MQPMKLFVSPDLVKSAQEMSNPLLKIPEDAVTARNGGKRWAERLRIEEAVAEEVMDDKGVSTGRVALRLRFKVSPGGSHSTNVNRTTRASYLVNLSASEGSGDRLMTDISLGRVNSLLRAAGFSTPDEGYDLSEFFCPASPLLNIEVNAVLMDRPDRHDPNIRRQDISNFTAVED